MANIFDVAEYILKVIGGRISTMKLQKLCYYCQAWNMVWENKPLFEEDFYKWDNGPVCKELFKAHAGEFAISDGFFSSKKLTSNHTFTNTEIEHIEQIIDDYGSYSGGQLSELTHKEDPWAKTPKNNIISKEKIKNYYRSLED